MLNNIKIGLEQKGFNVKETEIGATALLVENQVEIKGVVAFNQNNYDLLNLEGNEKVVVVVLKANEEGVISPYYFLGFADEEKTRIQVAYEETFIEFLADKIKKDLDIDKVL